MEERVKLLQVMDSDKKKTKARMKKLKQVNETLCSTALKFQVLSRCVKL